MDSETFSILDQNKFQTLTTNGNTNYFTDIPTKKLNMYINPRDMQTISPPPPPPAATLKRTSIMSSMKTNLDADDL